MSWEWLQPSSWECVAIVGGEVGGEEEIREVVITCSVSSSVVCPIET